MQERPRGRPTVFSPELAARIVASVAEHGFITLAAETNGVHRNTIRSWVARGEKGDAEFADFAHEVLAARARWAVAQLELVDDARWRLERADRELFRLPVRSEVSGPDGAPIAMPAVLTPEAADEIRRAVLYGDGSDDEPL